MTTIATLLGKTLTSVEVNKTNDEILFKCDDGTAYKMWHSQDCCESVDIESITGDLKDLIGHPILHAEESSREADEGGAYKEWTFYKLATVKGWVDIRWIGSTDGPYSISVAFDEVKQ